MSVELTPEVLDGIEARAKEATRHPGWVVEDVDTVLDLVAAARERDVLAARIARVEALHVPVTPDPAQVAAQITGCREHDCWPTEVVRAALAQAWDQGVEDEAEHRAGPNPYREGDR